MSNLPILEVTEASGGAVDYLYVASSLEQSYRALDGLPDECDARKRLFFASAYISDLLIYRSLHKDETDLSSPDVVTRAVEDALNSLRGGVSNGRSLTCNSSDEVYQKEFDGWSVGAFEQTDVSKLRQALQQISSTTDQKINYLAMANGAVPVSLLTWHYISEGIDANLYPVLFSNSKMEHHEPQLSDAEITYFRECAKNGEIFVIFEEDTQTGRTILGMMNALVRWCDADFDQIYGLTTSYSRHGKHAVLRRGVEGIEATVL